MAATMALTFTEFDGSSDLPATLQLCNSATRLLQAKVRAHSLAGWKAIWISIGAVGFASARSGR